MIVSILEPESRRLLARLFFTNPSRSSRHFYWRIYKTLRGPQGAGIAINPKPNADYRDNRRFAAQVARRVFNGSAVIDCEV